MSDTRRARRRSRAALGAVVVLAVLAVPGGAAMQVMAARGLSHLSDGTGASQPLAFDDLAIREPPPGEVVSAGFAPDPGFFSDREVASGLGDDGIPEVALDAYVGAEDEAAAEDPDCGIRWSLLAAIGRVESDHGRFGGAMLRADGYGTKPIRGLPLDGRPGLALVRDTDGGSLDGDTVYDRAVGPLQFIPSTWHDIGVDGNEDDIADPNNIYDAAWGAGVFLCAGRGDLTDTRQEAAAVRRYNHTDQYVRVVLSLAAAYERSDYDPTPGDDPAVDPGAPDVYDATFGDAGPAGPGPGVAVVPTPAPAPGPGAGPAPAPGRSPASAPGRPGAPAPAPGPRPAPAPPPRPAPAPPATTPAPVTTTTAPPTTAPVPSTTTPTTVPGSPDTTVPGVPTTVPGGDDGDGTVVETAPPASVGWSPTMLDFVTRTLAARAAP